MKAVPPKTMDEYIAAFPKKTQVLLQQLRKTIRKAAPEAGETINYGIPTFTLEGNLVHFAGYDHHIGFYPGAEGIRVFQKEFTGYKSSKGAVQFPLDEKLPLELVSKIVKFRREQNVEKALKKSLRVCKNGHSYHKSSDCPTCPVCEKAKKPKEGFLSLLAGPARRALENNNIKTLQHLAKHSEKQILQLHGMGPGSLPKLRAALKTEKLTFKK